MLLILTDEQAFDRMNADFENLSEHDVIDLAHDDKRFPAIVTRIDREGRAFSVCPLVPDVIPQLLSRGDQLIWETVKLPDRPQDRRPRWANLSKR